jgi:hypothetical protein
MDMPVNFQPIKADIHQEDWTSLLSLDYPDRGHYHFDEETLDYVQVAGRFLGCPDDIDDYLEMLYDLVNGHDPDQGVYPVYPLSEQLDKTISAEQFHAIQKILMIHQEENGLSVNRFVAFMEGESLLPLRENMGFYRHFRKKYIDLLTKFKEKHPKGLADPGFRRVVVDTVKWSWNHIDKWLVGRELSKGMPKVIWYGEASESQAYFLYFLILLGFDVVIFHPEGRDVLREIDEEVTPVLAYPSRHPLVPFPMTRPDRKATLAKKAHHELDQVLHTEDSLLFKPWQFRAYTTQPTTLKTTYDEVVLISREKAFIRPNFAVKNGAVSIPNLFCKIHGISINRKEYWSRIHELVTHDLSVSFTSFPFSLEVKGNQQFHYKEALTNERLDPKKMIQGAWWRFKAMPEGLQLGLANAISRYVEKAILKRQDHESLEQLKLFLFTAALELPESIVKLLQQFDYSQTVPKLVVFNNGKIGEMNRTDAALLVLLNEMGLDVIIYNPTGQNDIEFYLDSSFLDDHWLEEVSFDEDFNAHLYPSGSLLKKFIHKFL